MSLQNVAHFLKPAFATLDHSANLRSSKRISASIDRRQTRSAIQPGFAAAIATEIEIRQAWMPSNCRISCEWAHPISSHCGHRPQPLFANNYLRKLIWLRVIIHVKYS
jgi:hypothetical protein